MRSPQLKVSANHQSVRGVWLKLAPVAFVALLSLALPQMFGARARGVTNPPQGFLFTVTTLDDHNDFVCDGTDCTLREAIQAANNAATDDTIDFAVTGVINLASALPDIADSVTIEGPGADMLTVRRNSAGSFRIFNVTTTGKATFTGLTISNGSASSGGAGIENNSTGELNISNCVVKENSVLFDGAGINNKVTGTVNITNSTISNNSADFGGGILNDSTGTVTVTNSTISDNSSHRFYGGGIYNNGGEVSVIGSRINNNETGRHGGGIYNLSGTVSVTNSLIQTNSANEGGGGVFNNADLTITKSTLSGNSASGSSSSGGGITNGSLGTVTIIASTINDNFAASAGGISNSGTLNVINSTLSANYTTNKKSAGGLVNSGTAMVTNSTITRNFADPNQDGIGGVINSGPLFQIKSSIIALNIGGLPASTSHADVSGIFTSQGFNLIGQTDGSTGFIAPTDLTGTMATPLDPGLDPNGLQDNGGPTKTIALVCGSPAIDKGTSDGLTGNLFTDQRGTGFPRIIDDSLIQNPSDGADIGAFELPVCNHPPVALCKNIQVSAGNNCQASITAAQIDNGSFDPDKGDSIATRTLDNAGPFGLGPHTVMLTVTDTHGASASCTATVTVVDTTPPTLTCPPNKTVSAANGQCQAVVTYANPTVTDNCPGAALIGCAPPSGATFSVGTTTVTCTAKDGANNIGSCQFMVIVLDTQPPTITCPPNIIAVTVNPGDPSVTVNYPPPTASDNCGNVTVVCSPPSGAQFPRGMTTVTCTATDGAGNTATCTFTVTVFDVCVQDDTTRDALLFNSQTGDYLYRRCGAGGFTLSGRGIARVQGSLFTLEHYPSDRRVLAKVDNSVKKGTASVQVFSSGVTYTITDRNTADNNCACW